ncbi:unnamed protein product (macronuclear) [Paramecium tetraurelia]|uniref:Sperm-tail PG-rich repeat-containing protein 2 n=1 Tax=Paramecium tetraurelia TaxID=5888 RepID=A0E4L2_PARTE|nr:uncharacterized protein GSPATT00023404001 [Paramecium tetraurelia]CAK90229.1 unnamed protein product [Paramecium tetraurelia]|eukprot:XP_001457626.1 hypothetical protein (macronuclear) [Paramecium tetraurelia strain d4-2]
MNQSTTGTTPHGLTFSGAFTFGESQRLPWVKKDDVTASKLEVEGCKKFDDQLRRTESRISSKISRRKSNLPQDDKLKPVKAPNPPVGAYNIHNVQVIDEEQLKVLLEKNQTKEQQEKIKQMYTIQTSMGKRLSGGELDLHQTWAIHKPEVVKEHPIGPGSYNPSLSNQHSQPVFGFGYKQETKWAKEGPSPDQYFNSETFSQFKTATSWATRKGKKTGFGTAKKLQLPKSIDVGPGDYREVSQELAPKYSIPKAERELPSHKVVPSPDTYTPAMNQFKKAFSFGHKYIPILTTDYFDPGPGAHDPKLPHPSTAKEIKMLKENRSQLVAKESQLKPGPGTHDPQLPATRISHSKSQLSMGTGDRYNPNTEFRLSRDRVPSPGKYDINSSLQGPNYSIRLKYEQRNHNATPGPGQYDPDSQLVSDSFTKPFEHYTKAQTAHASLTKGNRSDPVLSKFKNIGPGSYSLPFNTGPRSSLGKAARFPPKEKEEIGPGSYYITGTIGIIPKYHFDRNRDKMQSSFSQFDKFSR